ncbi:hypothetical protein WNY98_01000 [Pseudoalteromonas sp. AS71]|uniref:hypothetical protein n=1 Tax=Pseudoalteromonas sp. AS71 TaxID=3135777 RepID=UPI003174537A
MRAPIYTALIVLALCSISAGAKPHKDKHGHKNHHSHKHNDNGYLSKKEAKQLIRAGWTPPGLSKSYHRGDFLERDLYKRGRVIERSRDNGTVSIEIDRTVIHMVHDTREILSILSR